MLMQRELVVVSSASSLWIPLAFSPYAQAQQTLGGITGTVTDKTGGVLPETVVTIVGDQTKLTRTQKTNANGSYDFVNLPIGTYTLSFTHDGFQSAKNSFHHGAGRPHRHGKRHADSRARSARSSSRGRSPHERGRYHQRVHP